VLCAYGDATTTLRDEAARTYIRIFSELTDDKLKGELDELAAKAAASVSAEGVPASEQTTTYFVDLRYHGQGFEIPVEVQREWFDTPEGGLNQLRKAFDAEHERLFSFLLSNEHELVSMRATVSGPRPNVAGNVVANAPSADASAARVGSVAIWVDGASADADLYDREQLLAGHVISGPAIVTEMDSTTLVLPGHSATVHSSGSLLIRPTEA